MGERSIVVDVIGTTRCRVDGRPVRLTGRERSVLAAVATGGGRPVPYEELFALVWGEEPPASARAMVHNAVSGIRRKAGAEAVVSDGGGYRLGAEVTTDSDRLLTHGGILVGQAPSGADPEGLSDLLSIVRGPAFEDLSATGVVPARREQVRVLVAGLEAHRAAAVIADGRLDEGLGLLRRALADEPTDPRLCGLAMIVLHRLGRTQDALEVYGLVRRRALDATGVEPPPWLTSIEHQILSGDPRLLADDAVDLPVRPFERRSRRRLVGRDDLVAAVRGDLAGQAAVLLHGPAGAGKTALLHEVVAGMDREVTVWVRGVETAASPFEPVVEVLDQLCGATPDAVASLRDTDLPALARLLPRLEGRLHDAGESTAAVDRARTDAALVDALVTLAARASVVVVVDDLHVVPEASQRLFAEAVGRGGIALAGSTRSLTLAGFAPGSSCRLIEVAPLTAPAVDELLRDVLGEVDRSESAPLARQLTELTGGNPFFVTSMIRSLADRGALRRHDGRWQIVGGVVVPEDVNRSILGRVDALSPVARALVEAACVGGAPGPAEEVEQVAGVAGWAAASGLQEALDAGLLRADGGIGSDHDLIAQAVEGSLPGAVGLELHARWADVLEQRSPPPVERVAHHRFASRALDPAAAIRADLAAAAVARRISAHEFALRHHRRARSLLADDDPGAARLDLAIGQDLRQLADPTHVDELLGVARRARAGADADLAAEALIALGDVGQLAGAGSVAGPIEDLFAWAVSEVSDLPRRARLQAAASAWFAFGPRWWRGPELWDEARATAVDVGDRRVLADVDLLVDPVTWAPGRMSLRDEVGRELLELGSALDDPLVRYRGHLALVAVEVQRGTRRAAEAHVAAMAELDRTRLNGVHGRIVGYFEAGLAQMAGDLAGAEERLTSASAVPSDLSPSWDLLAHSSVLLPVRREQGRLGELREVLEALVVDEPDVAAWRAVLAAATLDGGDTAAAERHLDHLATGGLERLPEDVTWMAVLMLLADVAVDLGRVDVAEAVAARLGPLADRACYCGHGLVGAVGTTLARVDALVGRVDDALVRLDEADAVARRLEAPIVAGHAAAERAALGLPEAARRELEEHRVTAQQRGWIRLADRLEVVLRSR